MRIAVRKAQSLEDRTRGLIGQSEIEPLWLETRFGIHTFGMRQPIDVMVLDMNNSVRVLKKGLKPNRVFIWNPQFKRVVELPSGYVQKKSIRLGEKIELTEQQE